eukprot:701032-Pleurochrysis_carterae.AAC.1
MAAPERSLPCVDFFDAAIDAAIRTATSSFFTSCIISFSCSRKPTSCSRRHVAMLLGITMVTELAFLTTIRPTTTSPPPSSAALPTLQ